MAKCFSCSKSAKYKSFNEVFCGKICQFDYMYSGVKRGREEDPWEYNFHDQKVLLVEFLLKVEPLELINSELVNKKYYEMVNNITFMERYVQKHEIPDEFMWWIYTKKNTILKHIVNAHYDGFFKDLRAGSDIFFMQACGANRLDLIEIIFKYKTIISNEIIGFELELACRTYNLALFQLLFSKVNMTSNFADALLDIVFSNYTDTEQTLTVKKMFFYLYDHVSVELLSKSVHYFFGETEILAAIFKKIPVEDEHLVEVIYNVERTRVVNVLEVVLKFGKPVTFKQSIESAKNVQNMEAYRFLKKLGN